VYTSEYKKYITLKRKIKEQKCSKNLLTEQKSTANIMTQNKKVLRKILEVIKYET